MTITSSSASIAYPGTGSSGPFAFPFKIFAVSHLSVTTTDPNGIIVQLNYPVDFAVSVGAIGSTSGGSLTTTNPVLSGWTLTIERVVPLLQLTDLRDQGTFFPATYEDALDYLTMIGQQIQGEISEGSSFANVTSQNVPSSIVGRDANGNFAAGVVTADIGGLAIPHVQSLIDATSPRGGALTPYLANNAVFNVKDFGAKGDGVTDDTAAINSAAQAAIHVAGTIVMPPGTYVISGDILLNSACNFVADGVTINSTAGRMRMTASRIMNTGSGTSTFNFVNGNPALSLDRAFRIEGNYNGSLLGISAPIAAGVSSFTATNAGDVAGLVLNNWLYICEYSGGQMRGEWKQVLSVVGTTVTLTSPFRRALSLYTLGFFIITPSEDIVISGWKIVTTGTANDNYGVDAELGRNFTMRDMRFDIARGMAWQVYWQDAPTIENCAVDRQVGRRSSVGACTDFYFGHLRFGSETAFPTAGAMSFETACAWGVAEDIIAYGTDLSGTLAVQLGAYIDFVGCVVICDGATIGLFVSGGEGIRSIGCRFFNCLDGVRYDQNAGYSPSFPATSNASIGDIMRTCTNGVQVRSAATLSSVYLIDTDATVTTPVLNSGTGTAIFNRNSAGTFTFAQQLQLTGAPTNVTQLLLGSSSAISAVGTRYSSGDAFLVTNATSALGSDLWTQSNSGNISTLMLLGITGSIFFYTAPAGTAAAVFATFWTLIGQIDANHFVNMAGAGGLKVGSVQVVGAQKSGWNAPTTGGGGLLRGTFDTGSTLLQTAETLAALITDLRTQHGLLGT